MSKEANELAYSFLAPEFGEEDIKDLASKVDALLAKEKQDGYASAHAGLVTFIEECLAGRVEPTSPIMQMLDDALAKARNDRDMDWWQAVVLNDGVAPTPEAAKDYLAREQQHWIAQAREDERKACADLGNRKDINTVPQLCEAIRARGGKGQ